MKTVDFFSETIAASDLKLGRCRQLIEFMKVCEYLRSRSYYIFQVLYVLWFTRPRYMYQVSVYRTIGPLVLIKISAVQPAGSKNLNNNNYDKFQ